MVSNRVPRKWTIEEYLAYEDETDLKHEFIDGEIYAMSGGTKNHSFITGNAFIAVGQRLSGSSCRIHTSDMRVRISDTKYVYPDFSVVCGDGKYTDDKETTLINPTLCVEVMSPSSETYDKTLKVEFYRSVPSLQHYLIIDQNQVYVRLHTKHDVGWLLQEFNDIDMVIPLVAIGVELPIRDVYRDITFDGESS